MPLTELRIFGPPGCGKTTYTTKQIARAAEKFGNDKVMVASFTRAAAAELNSRGQPVPRHMIGTLHAHAYRALGQPEIAEGHMREWNEFANEKHVLGEGGKQDIDEVIESNFATEGDKSLNRYNVYRAMLRPREFWEADVLFFAERWEAWKRDNQYLDFTDLIECAIDLPGHPHAPRIGFFDEAQDFTPLELALVRSWGEHMDYIVMAGDDDQNIYAFKGATPDAFLDPPLPADQKRVLSQSYRVPRTVHGVACLWADKLSRREPKIYNPREYEGEVRTLWSPQEYGSYAPNYDQPDKLLEDAQRYLENGKTVMFIGSCAYMVEPLKAYMKSSGIPFQNQYRRKRGDWNPLAASKGTSVAQRLAAFLKYQETDWTPKDIATFAYHLSKPKVFVKGGEKRLETLPMQYRPIPYEMVREVLSDGFISGVSRFGEDYFIECLTPANKQKYDYAMRVSAKYGATALTQEPPITIGTIHSVKGGEKDAVYLFPDLSREGYANFMTHPDETIRLMYVGMTRAKESLCLTSHAGAYTVGRMSHV